MSSAQAAQQFLDPFLLAFNQRFAVKSSDSVRAWRKLPRLAKLDSLFSFKFDRTVSADNIVRIGNDRIQLESDSRRSSYARARVQVHIRMDGHIDVYYKNRCLTSRPAPPEAPVLRLQQIRAGFSSRSTKPSKKKPSPFKPPRQWKSQAKDHPWHLDYRDMYEPVFPPR